MLKSLRLLHLYTGVFIAPALLFFALTGALQTFGLHEPNASGYKPAKWMATLGQLHKKQTTDVPVKRVLPAPSAAAGGGMKAAGVAPAGASVTPAVPAAPATKPKTHMAMKIFFAIVAWGLFVSTVTGIYMAYKYRRNPKAVTLCLVMGVVVPLVLLKF